MFNYQMVTSEKYRSVGICVPNTWKNYEKWKNEIKTNHQPVASLLVKFITKQSTLLRKRTRQATDQLRGLRGSKFDSNPRASTTENHHV